MLEVITLAATLLIAWIFINTAVHKLANPAYTTGVITKQLPFLGETVGRVVGLLLGVVEGAVAVAILLPSYRYAGAWAATALLCMYALMMLIQLLQGRTDLDCGCSGPARRQKISRKLVIRNIILMSIAGLVAIQTAAQEPSLMSGQALWLLAVPFALLSVLIYISSEQLMSNRQKLSTLQGER